MKNNELILIQLENCDVIVNHVQHLLLNGEQSKEKVLTKNMI